MFILSLCSKRRWPLSPAALILLLLPVAGLAQPSVTIKGCIKGLPFKKIYIEQLSSSNPVILDSAYTSNDCFQFQLTDTLAPGMYSIILNREYNSFIRILLNHEGNIEFSTNYMSMQDSIRFRGSVENTTYYSFLRYYNQSQLKNAQFQKMIEISEGDITVTNKLREAIAIKENNRIAHCLQLAKDHRGTIAADFINASTPIEVPALADSLSYQMEHLLDHFNFESNALFHSDLFLNAIINNLNLADKYSKNFNEMVENYLLVMDKVLEKSARNPDIYNFFRNRFRQWFTYGNMDVIATYNDKYYTEIPHPISIGREEVRKRLIPLVAINKGKKAPPIIMTDFNGRPFSLDSISNEYTLLVFFTSYCSHCIETLPKLSRLYQLQYGHKLEVVALSFDTERDAWLGLLKQGNYGWINYTDLKGWNSPIAKAYNIKGTPTYLLLDRNKYVIDKPLKYEELVADLENLIIVPRQ